MQTSYEPYASHQRNNKDDDEDEDDDDRDRPKWSTIMNEWQSTLSKHSGEIWKKLNKKF